MDCTADRQEKIPISDTNITDDCDITSDVLF